MYIFDIQRAAKEIPMAGVIGEFMYLDCERRSCGGRPNVLFGLSRLVNANERPYIKLIRGCMDCLP